ncbi:MAG: hypothetical protein QOG21_1347 [Actinomycetota bacterium]|nr:hypothetical protein [Actinomycetota bacterium]
MEDGGAVRAKGEHYRVNGAKRGPAPAHNIGIWVGGYKRRMLQLIGREGDGWLPSLPYLEPGDLAAGNAVIDDAAAEAGRAPYGLEDDAVFPHLVRSDPDLETVIKRLAEEHLVIHDAIQNVDHALVDRIKAPHHYNSLEAAIGSLSDVLLSHLSYEEQEIVEPLARAGFYEGQV